jgi:hypothetical protein
MLCSCTEEIPFDLNEEGFERIVVEGFITDQVKSHQVKLSRTTSYFNEEQPVAVSDAVVSVSNGIDTWSMTESPVGSGYYTTPSDAYGIVGQTHQLTIELDGETYVALDDMPSVALLEDMRVEYELFDNPDEDDEFDGFWSVRIWTTESPGTRDFYRWRTYINGVTDGDTARYGPFANDIAFDGAVLENVQIDGFSEDVMEIGDTIRLEQHGISEEYFDMIQALLDQTEFQGGLFDPPPANVPSNVSNGALGFFSASSVSDRTFVIE